MQLRSISTGSPSSRSSTVLSERNERGAKVPALSHTGRLKLVKLRTLLIANGFRDVDVVEEATFGSGEPWMSLAVLGFLFDAFPACVLHWLQGYEWFVEEATDHGFVSQLWRVLQIETGHVPAITVTQFFAPRFAEHKIDILLEVLALMKRTARRAKGVGPHPRRAVPHSPTPRGEGCVAATSPAGVATPQRRERGGGAEAGSVSPQGGGGGGGGARFVPSASTPERPCRATLFSSLPQVTA